jgi:hypothetical protein
LRPSISKAAPARSPTLPVSIWAMVRRPCRVRLRQIHQRVAQGQHLVGCKRVSGLPQVLHRISAATFEPPQAELVG